MEERTGGRWLADKNGNLKRDPSDTPTAPIPAEGEPGYAESAATPNAPETAKTASDEPVKPAAKSAKQSED